MNRIQELEAEIRRIKRAEADQKKAKYQHLVDKCVRKTDFSYDKIVSIERVETDEYGDKIIYDCVTIYFNPEDGINMNAGVQLQSWGQGYAKELEIKQIQLDTFIEVMNECINLIKSRIGGQ